MNLPHGLIPLVWLPLLTLQTDWKSDIRPLSWLMLTAVFDHDSLRPSPSRRRWYLDPILNYWIEFLNDTPYFLLDNESSHGKVKKVAQRGTKPRKRIPQFGGFDDFAGIYI